MSKEEESLQEPIEKILEGIKEFNEAATFRLYNDTAKWSQVHRAGLTNQMKELLDVQHKLISLKKGTY